VATRLRLLHQCHARRLIDLEHVALRLPLSPRSFLGAALGLFRLSRGHIGKNLAQPLVLDDRRLIDLLKLVEGSIGQVAAFVADGDAPIGIIDDRHALAGERTRHFVRLEHEQHLVVLQGEIVRQRALLLPGEDVLQCAAAGIGR